LSSACIKLMVKRYAIVLTSVEKVAFAQVKCLFFVATKSGKLIIIPTD